MFCNEKLVFSNLSKMLTKRERNNETEIENIDIIYPMTSFESPLVNLN